MSVSTCFPSTAAIERNSLKIGNKLVDLSGQFFFNGLIIDENILSAIAQFNSLTKFEQGIYRQALFSIDQDIEILLNSISDERLLGMEKALKRRKDMFIEGSNEKAQWDENLLFRIKWFFRIKNLKIIKCMNSHKGISNGRSNSPSFNDLEANIEQIIKFSLDIAILTQNAGTFNMILPIYSRYFGEYRYNNFNFVSSKEDNPLANSVSPAEGKTVFSDIDAEIAGIKERSKQRAEEIKQLKESLK